MLIVKYERKDFFGQSVYTEDQKQFYDKQDLKKAFLYLGRANNIAIQIENTIIFWNNLTEYENRIVTVRNCNGMNYTEAKKSYDKAKKEAYATIL